MLKSILPVLSWLPEYKADHLKGDLSAGLTVGVMLIPQGMAYALIAGLPPIYGLYASTVPLIIYALLGTSRQLAVGPVAMVSLLTAAGVGTLAEGGTELYISLAITLAFMVGMIQFVLGISRLGFLVNFLSHPVISGFTSAAALIIGLSQLKHLLGVDIARSSYVHEILLQAFEKIGEINGITLAIGLGGIVLIKVVKAWNKAIPGPLVVTILGILAVWGFGLHEMGVRIVGSVPDGLSSFSLPDFEIGTIQSLLPTALAISLISFMESIAVAKSIQRKHRDYELIPNQELIGLGLANVIGSFFQSYPVTGGFSRTAVNDQAGAKTGMASIISAGLIILTLLFLTPLFYFLPKAVLASIIMVAVANLVDFHEAQHLWKVSKTDFWLLVVTFFGTLALGIETGIGIGVGLSIAMLLYRTSRPYVAILGNIPGTHFYRNVDRFTDVITREDVLIIRFDAQLYFANIQYFKEKVAQAVAEKGPALNFILINAESINNVDASALYEIKDMVQSYYKQNIQVIFSGIKGPVRDMLGKADMLKPFGEKHFFLSIQEAIDFIDGKPKGETPNHFQNYTLQANS